nr:glycosyltransferase [uncultured Butyrivibrio sp.]
MFFRYKNICEPDYIEAFKQLGINVIEVDLNSIDAKSLEVRANAIGELIRANTPMFVFSINFFPYISIVCEALNVQYVSVSVTCPMIEIFNLTIRNSCNRVFLFDKEQYKSIRDENPGGIFYLPLGSATDRLSFVVKSPADYKFDISFIGSLYNEKDPFRSLALSDEDKSRLEDIIKRQFEVSIYSQDYLEKEITDRDVNLIKECSTDFYSSDLSVRNLDRFIAINNYLSPHMTYLERANIINMIGENFSHKLHLFTRSDTSAIPAIENGSVSVHGPVNSITEMPLIFRDSKINLNTTTRSMKSGLAQRIWDILGCGGFLLTNYQPEIEDYFDVGKDLEVYESYDELLEKIDYFLKDEDRRLEIASNGHATVKALHSTLFRVIEIIKKIAP